MHHSPVETTICVSGTSAVISEETAGPGTHINAQNTTIILITADKCNYDTSVGREHIHF